MGLWHRLSSAVDLPGVECLLAKDQEVWETEYNEFINELSDFVNKELNDFWCNIVSMGESVIGFRISSTEVREFA